MLSPVVIVFVFNIISPNSKTSISSPFDQIACLILSCMSSAGPATVVEETCSNRRTLTRPALLPQNNRGLALPFMIWTIITQVACGIFIAVFIFFVAVADWSGSSEDIEGLIRFFVVPLVCFIINFIIYTWWLVVVFDYYNLLKSGQAFDSIPMQTA